MINLRTLMAPRGSQGAGEQSNSSRATVQIKALMVLGVLVFTVFAAGPAIASDPTARVNTPNSRLNCRYTPGGSIVRTLPHKAAVVLTGKTSGAWRQVSYNGTTCWAHGAYLVNTSKKVDVGKLASILSRIAAQKQADQKRQTIQKPARVCSHPRVYDMLLVIPKSFRLPNGRVVGANQNHFDNSYELARHIEHAYDTYSNGCIDINVTTSVSSTPVAEWSQSNGIPYITRYKNKFPTSLPGGGKWDLFAFTTPTDIVPSGAAGARSGNGMWIESRPGAGYIADHELLHWIEGIVGSNGSNVPRCAKHPTSWVHCSTAWGYRADSPAWFTDVLNARVGGNKGMTSEAYNRLPL